MPNPYLLKDVNNIIDVFTDPSVEEIREGKATKPIPTTGTKIGQFLADFPSWAANIGGDASLASAMDSLQEYMDEAKSAIDTLYSYGTASSGTDTTLDIDLGVEIKGVNVYNTYFTMSQEDASEAFATLVADCIPCQDRILSLLSLNPLKELWDIFERSYQQMVGFVLDLYDFLLGDKSIGVFADFCSLFNFLNFMCIPDLAYIMIVFSNLIAKYSMELKDVKMTFTAFLSKIMGPALTPFAGLLEKYIQLLFGPIECIIESVDAQLAKLEVRKTYNEIIARQKGEEVNEKRDLTAAQAAGKALKEFKYTLLDGVDKLKGSLDAIEKDISDFLDFRDERDKQMFDITERIKKVAQLVGIVQAIIMMAHEGKIYCGPDEGNNREALQAFTDVYNKMDNNIVLVLEDNQIKVKPNLPDKIGKLHNVLSLYKKEDDFSLDKIYPSSQKEPKVTEIVIPVKNCLTQQSDPELAGVKDFLENL